MHGLPETPAEALGPTIREEVLVEGRTFLLTRPDAVDRLVDHPELGGASAAEEYMPFWAHLWPAARMLAAAILCEPWPRVAAGQPLEAVEVGCGLGLAGLAALARGLHVTFSDYDATALRFAADNARLNGFSDFRVLQMDYRQPPAGLQTPVLLASDPIYEIHMAPPLARLIRQVLAPGGTCLVAERNRPQGQALQEALRAQGLTFTLEAMRTELPDGQKAEGTLYRITHGSVSGGGLS